MKRTPGLAALLLAPAFAFAAPADVAATWTALASESLLAEGVPSAVAGRSMQCITEAMASAGRSARGGEGDSAAQRHDAAVSTTAFAILERLVPGQREHLESRLAVTFSYLPETKAKAEGAALGRKTAEAACGAG